MATSTPSFSNFSPKSFWSKPEGKPGMVILAALAFFALFYGWGVVVPFFLTTIQDTFWLTVYGVGLAAMADVILGIEPIGKQVRSIIKNVFQSLARGAAMLYTTIYPIGILKNNLDDMRSAKGDLDKTIQRFAGSDNNLATNIGKKNAEIQQLGAQSIAAGKMLASKSDPLERERIQLSKETFEQKAGLLMQAVAQLQALKDQTSDMLNKFRHWSQISDAKIDRTAMKVEIFAEQRKMILDAKGTLSVGMRLLKGDPEQLKLVDGAIEFLTEDAARTLGEIKEFNRFSDKMLTDIDIENSANAEVARQKFAEFGVKLDESSKVPSAVDQLQAVLNVTGAHAPFAQGQVATTSFNPTSRGTAANGGYDDMFKK